MATSEPTAQGNRGTDVETHFTVIAILDLLGAVPMLFLGVVLAIGGFIGAGFAETFANVPAVGELIAGAGIVLGLFFVALAVPGIISAIGLIQRKSWAKPWTIVVAVISLPNIPLGTAFGAYAIWAMTRDETDVALGQRGQPTV